MTIEGQIQFKLAPELRSDVLINDLPFQWPKIDTSDWTIGGGVRKRNQQNPQFGEMNSNLKEPHVACQPASGCCIRPVQIIGQCCKEQCGAVIQWRQSSLNFSAALELTREMERKVLVEHEDVGISLIRIDETDPHPLYQLAVLPRRFSNFDEQLFSDTLDFAFEALRYEGGEDSGGASSSYALKRQCSSNTAFFLNLGTLFKWAALGGSIAVIAAYVLYDQYSKNDRFRSVLRNCLQASSQSGGSGLRPAVAWRRAREEVELLWNASRISLPKLTTRRVSANTDTGTSSPEGDVTTSVQLVEYANPVFSTFGEEISEAAPEGETSELS